MLFLLVLCIFFSAPVLSESQHHLFEEWKIRFDKQYASPREEKVAFTNFLETVQRVQKRISVSPKGGAKFGHTKFADLSSADFKAKFLMKNEITPKEHGGPLKSASTKPSIAVQVPSSYDWRKVGAVTGIQNQGQCGSSWAMAATATIESAWMLRYNLTSETMKPLSNQQIIDCDKVGNGCTGGTPQSAYDYIISTGGQEIARNYPYTSVDEGTCKFNKDSVLSNIKSYDYACETKQEQQLIESTFTYGPLTICVDASNWQDYESGVMSAWDCAWYNNLNHCVQLVGWDLNSSSPHWIAKNSWSTNWGEEGFIRLEYGTNTCGLSTEASFVVAA